MTSPRHGVSGGGEEDGERERVAVAGAWPLHNGDDCGLGRWGTASVAEQDGGSACRSSRATPRGWPLDASEYTQSLLVYSGRRDTRTRRRQSAMRQWEQAEVFGAHLSAQDAGHHRPSRGASQHAGGGLLHPAAVAGAHTLLTCRRCGRRSSRS